jgi:hypothetical protein
MFRSEIPHSSLGQEFGPSFRVTYRVTANCLASQVFTRYVTSLLARIVLKAYKHTCILQVLTKVLAVSPAGPVVRAVQATVWQ